MANIEFYQSRLEGKEKKLEKLEKKLERIQKAQDSGWKNNPYLYSESDLKYTLRDIDGIEADIDNLKITIEEMQKRENSRNIKVIVDFIDKWKATATEIFTKDIKEYYGELTELAQKTREVLASGDSTSEDSVRMLHMLEEKRKHLKAKVYGVYDRSYGRRFPGIFAHLKPIVDRSKDESTALKVMEVLLDEEAKNKYDTLIDRVVKEVGEIKDAKGLYIADNGDLNGFIDGENGRVKVSTIGAGGYNIQCFHFRVLIRKI